MSWLKAKDWATGVEYSSLFHSGLRAISLRPRAHCARGYSPSLSSEESSSGGRTSSVASLSSCLLKRSTTRTRHPSAPTSTPTNSGPGPTLRTSKVMPRQRTPSMLVRSSKDSEMSDAWSSAESFSDLEEHVKSPEEEYKYPVPAIEIDGIRSPAGSRSFLVNLGERDVIPVGPAKDEPFLLLSSSPDTTLFHPVPRHERPVSMPLPPRRTPRETGWERGDCAWMLEGSSPEVKVYEWGEAEEEIQPDDEPEDLADWRQFHSDLLQTIR